jgi:IclR family acetate operon transcriptional repressor
MSAADKYIIPSLQSACRVLKLLGQHPKGLSLTEIAKQLEIPYTTTIRIISTLEREQFVSKSKRSCRLGPVLTQLNLQRAQDFDLREIAAPAMKDLAVEADETVHLAIPAGYKALILDVCDSPHPVRVTSRPGTMADAHCCSTGKIFIAYLFADRLEELAAESPLVKRTERTITGIPALETEIRQVRKQGYAVDDEEFFDGVRCLAAPIFDRGGKVIAAVGITAGVQRFTRKRIPEIARFVKAAADKISKQVTV